jgi:anthranilate phosphoribosyltransferase
MLQKLLEGRSLAEGEAEGLLHALMEGRGTDAQIGAILVLLRQRGETVSEVVGFARAMHERALRIELPKGIVVDICGRGGDGPDTFDVTTLAALVVATAGVPVAREGDRSTSGPAGSADLLEGLGVRLDLRPPALLDCLRHTDFMFLHASRHHPAIPQAAGPRRELGVRTVFDLLGSLTNPAGATHRLLGVHAAAWVPLLAEVLMRLGCHAALVVHGEEGLDGVSPVGPTTVAALRQGRLDRFTWQPEDAGLQRHSLQDLQGGDLSRSLAIAWSVLRGEPGAFFDGVVLNAGAALSLAGSCKDLWTGAQEARLLLQSGQVQRKLREIADFTQRVSP